MEKEIKNVLVFLHPLGFISRINFANFNALTTIFKHFQHYFDSLRTIVVPQT